MLQCIDQISIDHEIVFLRIDANVPIDSHGTMINDFRLQSIRPTLDYLLKTESTIILLTHRGRPNLTMPLEQQHELSNKKLIPWFNANGYNPFFYPDLQEGLAAAKNKKQELILLENMRFFSGEQHDDPAWTELFNNVASIYVNDAFSILHRQDTSVTKIPLLCQKKAYGFHIKKEIIALQPFHTTVNQPYSLIIGGNKSHDKIKMIKKIVEKPKETRPKTILMGGLLSLPFLIAQNKLIYTCDTTLLEEAIKTLLIAEKNDVKIILPLDHVYFNNNIIDIGPQTIELFKITIRTAQTILCNGPMGNYEDQSGQEGTKEILRAINKNNGFSALGGGNTVDAAKQYLIPQNIDLISTGGGALLAYVAAANPEKELPGLSALQII